MQIRLFSLLVNFVTYQSRIFGAFLSCLILENVSGARD